MSEENINQFSSVATDDEQLSEELSEKELKSVAGGSDSPSPLLSAEVQVGEELTINVVLGGARPEPINYD